MLNVHRTENQLKSQTVSKLGWIDFDAVCCLFDNHKTLIDLQEELDVLRTKFEKMDKERQELRQQNEKLESRVRPKILIAIWMLIRPLI